MQFWEDVQDGLKHIHADYHDKDFSRIQNFISSAQGITPAPKGLAPFHQPCEEFIEGLTAKNFWNVTSDSKKFPWAVRLEENSHIIIEELEREIYGVKGGLFAADSAWQNDVMGKGWSAFRLQRLGVWNEENCKRFPRTFELIKSLGIPLAVRGVCFACQNKNSGVEKHSDGRNFILTSHLGLKIPKGVEVFILPRPVCQHHFYLC